MKFFVVGLNHNTAPVELRERLAVNLSDLVGRARDLKSREDLDEIVILSTCNRVEIYAATSEHWHSTSSLLESLSVEPCNFRPNTYIYENFEAVRHLFRVAAGLDSMVLGETEIIGQVKKAYDLALGAQLTGGTLNRIFQKTFQVVKEIRTRTGIGRGAASVGAVTARLAENIFHDGLSRQSILVLGAGQVSESCVRHLAKKGAHSILVSNRSFERAVELATQFGGRAVRFEDSLSEMADADIIVASTGSPNTLLHQSDIAAAMVTRRNRPLVLIDLSVPRNIDPDAQRIENVYLYNIDDLNAVVRENVLNREQDIALCDQIIEAGAAALIARLNSRRKEQPGSAEFQFQPGCVSYRSAVAIG